MFTEVLTESYMVERRQVHEKITRRLSGSRDRSSSGKLARQKARVDKGRPVQGGATAQPPPAAAEPAAAESAGVEPATPEQAGLEPAAAEIR